VLVGRIWVKTLSNPGKLHRFPGPEEEVVEVESSGENRDFDKLGGGVKRREYALSQGRRRCYTRPEQERQPPGGTAARMYCVLKKC